MKEYRNPMVPELSVTDFKKSLSFYQDILGFKVRNKRTNPNFAYLIHGQVQIMLEEIHETAWITQELIKPLGRGINFQMEIDDLSLILSRLNEANISVFQESQETWYDIGDSLCGQFEFLVQDPDGYLLRITKYLGEKRK